ncbi:MAG: LexA family protein, partial [Gammaproteobacteria bacterium]
AGFPSPAEDYIEGMLDLNTYLIKHPAATFFVRVRGDSMSQAGIFPNDLLIVDRSITANYGNIVIAIVEGELIVKRLARRQGKLFLDSENPTYQPIAVKGELQIWGVVTNVIHAV